MGRCASARGARGLGGGDQTPAAETALAGLDPYEERAQYTSWGRGAVQLGWDLSEGVGAPKSGLCEARSMRSACALVAASPSGVLSPLLVPQGLAPTAPTLVENTDAAGLEALGPLPSEWGSSQHRCPWHQCSAESEPSSPMTVRDIPSYPPRSGLLATRGRPLVNLQQRPTEADPRTGSQSRGSIERHAQSDEETRRHPRKTPTTDLRRVPQRKRG